jgi:hypothetical protein
MHYGRANEKLLVKQYKPCVEAGLSDVVYTALTNVEIKVNGDSANNFL